MEKIKQFITAGGEYVSPLALLRAVNDLFSRQALASGALAAGTTTTKVKITNAIPYVLGGVAASIAAADGTTSWVESGTTVLPTNTLTATQIGGYVLTVDNGGLFHALPLGPSSSLTTAPQWPAVPPTHVVFGVILINTAGATTFTAGTTVLSAANVALINVVGPFVPTNLF